MFGGSNPAAVLYLKQEFIDRNPNTVQALVNAFYKTLKWLEKATPEEIAATVPVEYFLGDKALYLAAVKANKPVYSLTGVIPAAGMRSAADMLLAFDEELREAKIDLAKTFDDRFVRGRCGQIAEGLCSRGVSEGFLPCAIAFGLVLESRAARRLMQPAQAWRDARRLEA
jgi:NitT/TauT family transport system substrate-binding protein